MDGVALGVHQYRWAPGVTALHDSMPGGRLALLVAHLFPAGDEPPVLGAEYCLVGGGDVAAPAEEPRDGGDVTVSFVLQLYFSFGSGHGCFPCLPGVLAL